MVQNNDFFKSLEDLKQKVDALVQVDEQATVQSIRKLRDELRLGDSTVGITLLNGSTVSYLVAPSGSSTRDIVVGEWVVRGS